MATGAGNPQTAQDTDYGREPCPDRILDDIGGAFGMGALGGGLWHTYRGLKNSPKGYKLVGTLDTIRRESPRIGGNFANWGLMFSVFDCTCLYVRKKEDPFNAIMAGALTGGFLQLRSGLRPAFRSAVFGGALLALIEGLGITLSKMASPPPPSMPFPQPGMPGGPPVGAEGMAGLPPPPIGGDAAAAPGGPAAPAAGGSEGGGWLSWLTGGEEQKPQQEATTVQTFQDEGFVPPPIASESSFTHK
ncbi:mitochondrial import inner membrane translocase subunit Tim17 [Scenedesmus sp. NREL 46B-D3]|nr:mitochondrial import inner membrane translocase subunit Tim17 [Scenedesmus sp. NREL 46B-D3]